MGRIVILLSVAGNIFDYNGAKPESYLEHGSDKRHGSSTSRPGNGIRNRLLEGTPFLCFHYQNCTLAESFLESSDVVTIMVPHLNVNLRCN